MKATFLTSAMALLALSATAAPQQQAAPAEQQGANVPQQTLSAPASAHTGDSPLVAAAKRSGRLGKKPSAVITNETLVKSGGHFTTTKEQSAVAAAPAPLTIPKNTSAAAAPPPKAGATAKKDDKNETANKEKALKRAVADYMGESIEEVTDDPSAQEGVVSQGIAPKPAQAPKPAEAPKPAQRPPQL